MSIERERVPAVVILILLLIGAVVIYVLLLPAPVAYKLLGINNTSVVTPSIPTGEYFHYLNTYIGGNSQPINTTYTIGTFGVDYPLLNSTIFNKTGVSIGSSILGSSSYNFDFNSSKQAVYFIEITVQSVSGTPKMSFSLNGHSFFSTLPIKNETIIEKVPAALQGKNILSITDSLNGFAFTQSFTLSSVKIVKETGKNNEYTVPVKVLTFSGVGDYSIEYTPIGIGGLNVSINNELVSSIKSGDDVLQNISIPTSIVSMAIKNSNSPSSSLILPLLFNVAFQPAENVSYEIADASLDYEIPFIAQNSPAVYYSVNATKGNYILTLDIESIVRKGNVYLYFTPSGENLTMNAAKLSSGENIFVIPYDYLGSPSSGNYSGTIEISSNGLVIPSYISLKSIGN